jgi:hypothetical protein
MPVIAFIIIFLFSIGVLSFRDIVSNRSSACHGVQKPHAEMKDHNGVKPEAFRECVETKRNTSIGIELKGRSFNGVLLWYITLNNPESGMLAGQDDSILTDLVVLEDNHKLTYTPDRDFVGTDRFCFVVCDGREISEVAYVVIKVTDREPVRYIALALQQPAGVK